MGIFGRLLGGGERRASPYVEAFLRGDDFPNSWGLGGRVVSGEVALGVVAVFACVRVIAETLASLPLFVYRRLEPRGRERATTHPLFFLLHDAPNPEMSKITFWEAIVGHAVMRGTGYAEIQRDQDDRITALWPLRPDRIRPDRTTSRQLFWRYRMPDGSERLYDAREILTVPGFGGNGLIGYSTITLHAGAIGLALDTQEHASRFFKNDSTPGGVLQGKEQLSDEAFDRMKKSWEDAHRGVSNSHKVAILEGGWTWQAIGLTGRESQFIEQRRFSVEEIARLYRVPLHIIQELSHATFTNIEHQSIDFVVHTIRPWAERVEGAIERSLLTPDDRRTYFVEHLVDGLLRGDLKTRYEAYSVAKQNGILSSNDVRELENLNPIPAEDGGDVYTVQLNMTGLKTMLAEPDPTGQAGGGGQAARQLRARWPVGSPQSRLRIADRYSRLLRDAANRLVRREASEVREAARRLLPTRDAAGFRAWLRRYYGDFGAYAARTMTPSMLAYGEAIEEDAAAELGEDAAFAQVEAWLHSYATTFGLNYAGRSRGQLEQILDQAAEEETDELAAVETRLGEWEDTRPRKVSHNELTRLAGALVIASWTRRGVKKIQWVNQGKACAFCTKMNGKIVGIEHEFVHQGDEVEGDEQTGNFTSDRPVRHPPIHGFCRCGLRAIREG